jgi:hypothetical protein
MRIPLGSVMVTNIAALFNDADLLISRRVMTAGMIIYDYLERIGKGKEAVELSFCSLLGTE